MSDIGAQYVASALFPENVERFREQMPPFAPGGIVERHRQGRLRHGPEILPHFVRRDKQIGKAHQRKTVLERRSERSRRDVRRRDARQDPDRDVCEFRLPGPQFEQQPRHRQNAGVAGADHADLLPGCCGFERGPAPRHLAHHAVLDDWFSDDAITNEINVIAVSCHRVAMPERGIHLGRDLLGNAGAEPHNHDLSASSLGCGEVRQAGQRQRDVSKGGFRGVQCGLGD